MNRPSTAPSRRLLVAAPLIALIPAIAHAEDKVMPITKAFPYLKEFWGLPPAERSRFTVAYYLELDHRPAQGVTGVILTGGRSLPLGIDAAGKVTPLPSADLVRSGGQLRFTYPTGHQLNLNLRIEALMRPAATLPAPDLAATVTQAAKAIRKVAGPLGMMAPRLDRIGFKGPAHGEAVLADGRVMPLPTRNGVPYFAPGDFPAAATIRLPSIPVRLQLGGP